MDSLKLQKPLWKRITFWLMCGALFIFVFFIATMIATRQIFTGIEQSRATGLASTWDADTYSVRVLSQRHTESVQRNAAMLVRTPDFDRGIAAIDLTLSRHNGYFDELRTERESGRGRSLVANISVPAAELDLSVAELKKIGRVDQIMEGGADAAVKLAALNRRSREASDNLVHLQSLSRKYSAVRDKLSLQKDLQEAKERVSKLEEEHESLAAKIKRSTISLTMLEERTAEFDADFSRMFLNTRNSLVDGIVAIFSSASVLLGLLLKFGLPVGFWGGLLFFPVRLVWRRFHGKVSPVAG